MCGVVMTILAWAKTLLFDPILLLVFENLLFWIFLLATNKNLSEVKNAEKIVDPNNTGLSYFIHCLLWIKSHKKKLKSKHIMRV